MHPSTNLISWNETKKSGTLFEYDTNKLQSSVTQLLYQTKWVWVWEMQSHSYLQPYANKDQNVKGDEQKRSSKRKAKPQKRREHGKKIYLPGSKAQQNDKEK